MGRQPCCDKTGLKRGPWTIEEDRKLVSFLISNGVHCWRLVPKLAGLMRCGKSCRLRWTNYLRPDLKRGPLSEAEEDQIIQLHSRMGNRWSKIASHFPGRTDNEIKNHWNTKIKKRLRLLGVDPTTHMPLDRKGVVQSSPSEVVDESNEDKTILAPGEEKEKKEEDYNEVHSNGNGNGNGMMWESLNLEEMSSFPQQAKHPSSSCSTSLSPDDTLNISSVDGDSSDQEGFKYNNWADTIDSFPSWEDLYYLEEDVLAFGNFP